MWTRIWYLSGKELCVSPFCVEYFSKQDARKAADLKKFEDKCGKNDKLELVMSYDYKSPLDEMVHM